MNRVVTTLAILLCCLVTLFIPGIFMEPLVLVCGEPSAGWFPVVNVNHNAYYNWRVDHISRLFIELFSPLYSAEKPLFRLIILFVGTLLLTRKISNQTSPLITPFSLLPVLLVLAAVGINPLVAGSLAWMPLLAFVCSILLVKTNPRMWWLVAVGVITEHCLSANQASPLPTALAFLLACLANETNGRSSVSKRRTALVACLVFIPVLLTVVTTPMPDLPDYPRSGRVVPDDGVEGLLRPLVGLSYPFESIHRADVRALYDTVAIYVFALSLLSLLFTRVSGSKTPRVLAMWSSALALSAFLDTNLPEEWSNIVPIASISRLLPWGTHYCLTAICLGLAAWLLGMVWITQTRKSLGIALAMAALFSIFQTSPARYHPFLSRYTTTADPELRKILCSPSSAVIRHFAYQHPNLMEDLADMKHKSRQASVDVTSAVATITMTPTSPPPIEQYWRWSSRRGRQVGDEVLTIAFHQPTSLRGVELDSGTYFTDFPRGIEILGGPCDQNQARVLFSAPSWQGSLAFTPQGYPYLASRATVKALFNNEEQVSCLFVRQTGKALVDWSVSRVRIIRNH